MAGAASNAFPERVFSCASDALARKKVVLAKLAKKLLLKFNAPFFGMGYPSPDAEDCANENGEGGDEDDLNQERRLE